MKQVKSTKNKTSSRNFRKNSSNNYKGKFKKSGYSREDDKEYTGKEKINRNDPAWYGSNMLAQTASNLFFTKRFGTPILDLLPSDMESKLGYTNAQADNGIPGICALTMCTAFGDSKEWTTSPINIAAQAIYSYVRYANSGSKNYDTPDLMTYILAVPEVYSYIVMLQRLFGFINTYYPENAYMARRLVESMGFDFDDLIGNTATLCFYINTLISKATAFAIPSEFSYILRKVFLYQNVFIESDNIKDQMYMFNPSGFYQYTVDNVHPEAYLKYIKWWVPGDTKKKMTDIISYGNTLIQSLLDIEDAGIMSGDIIKAYGNDKLVKLAEMPLTYGLHPIVGDEYIMYQIRNATIVPGYSFPDLMQDANKQYLTFSATASISGASWTASSSTADLYLMTGNRILTSNKNMPTAEDVMESTRLMSAFVNPRIENGYAKVDVVSGTEVVTEISCYYFYKVRPNGVTVSGGIHKTINILNCAFEANNIFNTIVSAFRYHPTFIVCSTASDDSSNKVLGIVQECETITTVDKDELKAIHQAAILNMLAVPAIAKLQ